MRRIGIAVTVLALAGCTSPRVPLAAQQVAACEQTHRLTSAHQVTHPSGHEPTPEGGETPEGATLIESCTWPPARGADPDGYLRITVDTVEGPGQAEYTGDTLLDNVHGPCARYRLTYAYGFQGAHDTVVEHVRAGVSKSSGLGPTRRVPSLCPTPTQPVWSSLTTAEPNSPMQRVTSDEPPCGV